ncbi:4'-phosphopantetheinyl transferase family protein [Chondrinema litorale]|uniref:4'-phosphopantetheinyl transferase family protein n=1 Tax=Chondrinema litorale TaxID=2994555 RepID=UPI002543D881|nr:4'-phosphopantetheinyl transferase superfamily protein [Chondrinema litorale]UZR99512.1 4'-phosphopantetheinyl transferase superfamily protein [Chondrinema litorale]
MTHAAIFDISKEYKYLELLNPVEFFSERDLVSYNSYINVADKHRMLASRVLLNSMLKSLFSGNFSIKGLQKNEKGKPIIYGLAGLSISHSGDFAVVSISEEAETGIDIQKIGNFPEEDIHAILNQEEKLAYQALTIVEKQQWFYDVWSKKEAALKAMGEGLAIEMKELTFSNNMSQVNYGDQPWYFYKTPAINKYSLQLCSSIENQKISWFKWEQNKLLRF